MRRLDEVVQGFLRFTRPADLRLEPVALSGLFDAILPIVRAEADKQHIDIRVECPPDLPRINADAGLLEQACLNLALNACQAMPNGGRLRLAGAARPGRVEITVEDTGVGIPPEQLGRIFDLYFTTKENGSGIGLSMVYRTAQLHDGDIEVASVPGGGTTFRLTLPQAESAAGTRAS
jgi:signal transduction histidine kinase